MTNKEESNSILCIPNHIILRWRSYKYVLILIDNLMPFIKTLTYLLIDHSRNTCTYVYIMSAKHSAHKTNIVSEIKNNVLLRKL